MLIGDSPVNAAVPHTSQPMTAHDRRAAVPRQASWPAPPRLPPASHCSLLSSHCSLPPLAPPPLPAKRHGCKAQTTLLHDPNNTVVRSKQHCCMVATTRCSAFRPQPPVFRPVTPYNGARQRPSPVRFSTLSPTLRQPPPFRAPHAWQFCWGRGFIIVILLIITRYTAPDRCWRA